LWVVPTIALEHLTTDHPVGARKSDPRGEAERPQRYV
jgi:hypothetical protein